MKLPGLKSLQAFNAIGRHLSIRRAAEELGVDHSGSQVNRGLKSICVYIMETVLLI